MKNSYPIGIIPVNDSERITALARYRIFNTPGEPAFDSICKLAQTIFRMPITHVSFLDGTHEAVKASAGLPPMPLVDRGESLCALAVLSPEVTVIENALEEPLLDKHPAVHGGFGLRFYAGAPLITPDDYVIGTMCLVDREPRSLSLYEQQILRELATVVMDQVELRLANYQQSDVQEQTNARLQSILDTMAEGVGMIGLDGQLTYANEMAQKILGLAQDEIKSRTYHDPKWENLRVDGSALPEAEHPMAIMMATRQPVYDMEIGVQPPDKERFYISINAAPIFDADGELAGGIGTFMDVTRRRKLIMRQDEFISVVSHELKTPLTGLKGALQLLNRDPSESVRPKLLEQANRSINKITRLVEDLLNFSRTAEGQLRLNKTEFNLSELIQEAAAFLKLSAVYQLVLEGDEALRVEADRDRVEQVLINLFNNAFKYAPGSKDIGVRFEKTGSSVKISVSDHGPGISAEQQAHVFERYYQGERLQNTGLGLGLYISAEIIKRHGGQIGVISEPGAGSTFWFTLPLTPHL
ncbi:PAS domain-containing protein [Mucilaginibacter corticis]|uniref:histidine kinase n=1 Tax=Mucilaginibacter corticis TaxID=2597670 RepID=A0A556M7L9_9SPHI|nr:ATP-binding protein [Mucilaginibacter corticis]TSJ35908.1 PAS domain-containing protein [Mucilaginibacter corticis]